tara:strand:+ start:140 stop:439 length:300 start_codon:yes stop_codon:yes gene_type:complete
MSIRRAGIIGTKKNFKENTLFLCSDCLSSIQKDACNNFYYCNKCNLRLCYDCYQKSNMCINGCKKLYTFVKNEEVRVPENLESFHPVILQKYNKWCCYF